MLAVVRAQIEIGDRALDEREHRLLDANGIAGEREHRAVVRGVGGEVEEADARHPPDRVGHGRDDLGPPALADVRDTLDQHRNH